MSCQRYFTFCILVFLCAISRLEAEYQVAGHRLQSTGPKTSSSSQISVNDYCLFLNAVAASDPYVLYDEKMGSQSTDYRLQASGSETSAACSLIIRSGKPGDYCYVVVDGKENSVISYVDKSSAQHYFNWLEHSDSAFCSCDLFSVTCQLFSASTSTYNFNSCEVAASSFAGCDKQLKSNRIFFDRVADKVALTEKSSGKEDSSWTKDLEVAAALAIVIEEGTDVSNHTSASQEEVPPTRSLVNKNNKTVLTLDNFRNAVVTHPTATRLIIKKGKEGALSIEPEEGGGDSSSQEKSNGENEKIAKELKKVLAQRDADPQKVKDWFSSKNLLKGKQHPSLSAETVKQLLELSDQASLTEVPKSAAKTVSQINPQWMLDFQEKVKVAQVSDEAVQQSQSKIDPDFEEWLNNTRERFSFKVGKLRGMKADIENAIIKVAETNKERCLHYEKEKERIVLDPEIVDELGIFEGKISIKKSIAVAQEADAVLTDAIVNGAQNFAEVAHAAEEAWARVTQQAQEYCEVLKQAQEKVQGGLDYLEATDRYYQQHKTQCSTQLLKDQAIAEVAWVAVFDAAAITHHHILENENNTLLAARKVSLEAIIKAQQEKESFQRAAEVAHNCLQDHSIHFFQEEQVRSPFLQEMAAVWKRKDEMADFAQRATAVRELVFEETRIMGGSLHEDSFWSLETIDSLWRLENARLEISTIASSADAEVARTFSSRDEMEACKKALKAIQDIQAAEEVLTQQTKMEWMKEDEVPKNAWGNKALLNTFFDQKGEADRSVKQAHAAEKKFMDKMNKVKESYLALISVSEKLDKGSDSLGSENEMEAWRQWGGSIKSSWNEAKKAALTNQQVWDMAHCATKAAMDSKITWARNIFRMAGRCAGDFSLGQATKRDGELLGKLWIGSDDHSSRDEEGFDRSRDQLKRLRPLAYKSNLNKYQMNFEWRPTLKETWTQKGEPIKKGHANGHLTIINPHSDDAK